MLSGKSPEALRTIGEVAEQAGIATHVLRFWEGKFNQIKPQKRRGRRYYSQGDIQVICKIKELLYDQGYTIRGVQKFLTEELRGDRTQKSNESAQVSDPVKQVVANAFNLGGDLFSSAVGDAESDKPKIENSSVVNSKEALEDIYLGLCEARDKLCNIGIYKKISTEAA